MNYVKLFFVAVSIVAALKEVILPLRGLDREKVLDLFDKAYELLPGQPVSSADFRNSIDKWLNLYVLVVDLIWEFNPELCHKLAWSIVKAEQSAWLWIVEQVQKNLKGYLVIDEGLNRKINEHIHAYNLKVLEALLEKDFEIQRKKFDDWCSKLIEREVEILKEKLNQKLGEPVGGWVFYIDRSGIYVNGLRLEELEKWTGLKLF